MTVQANHDMTELTFWQRLSRHPPEKIFDKPPEIPSELRLPQLGFLRLFPVCIAGSTVCYGDRDANRQDCD